MLVRMEIADSPTRCIVIAPNRALLTPGLVGLYGGVAVVSLVVASVFAAFGYWPVFVFAVLEWLAISGCAIALVISSRYREQITVTDDTVTIDKRYRGQVDTVGFQRHWTTVEHREDRSWYPSELMIKSGGVMCEVGHCLTEDERRTLKQRLERLIGSMGQAPDLVI